MIIDFNKIDINEQYMYTLDTSILKMLLKDKTTGKNIIWATNEYASLGDGYTAAEQIYYTDVEGLTSIIIPRVIKSKTQQTKRARGMAEVFTPSWVCNKQNNLVDSEWFGRKNVFNIETEKGWITVEDKIVFPDEPSKSWQDYVLANRLEITCGEAPYLVSRYDAVTGELIPVKDRIGLLDRKLRIVSENVDSEPEWYAWAKKAVQSVYGFDWQGDNVLLARENLLFTFMDFYEDKFGVPPYKKSYLREIANILSWNIFQMDGVKFVIPNSCNPIKSTDLTIFGEETTDIPCPGCQKGNHSKHTGIYARTYNWTRNRSVESYSTFIKEKKQDDKI